MTGRWARIALAVSLAVNVFLIGAGATVIARNAQGSLERSPSRPALRAAAAGLAPKDRDALMALLHTQGRGAKHANREARALRAEAWGSLAETSFDPAAAKAKLARARALNHAARGAVENGVIDFAATLPAGERAALGEALGRGRVRRGSAASPRAAAP